MFFVSALSLFRAVTFSSAEVLPWQSGRGRELPVCDYIYISSHKLGYNTAVFSLTRRVIPLKCVTHYKALADS